jgi:hypothetical protein
MPLPRLLKGGLGFGLATLVACWNGPSEPPSEKTCESNCDRQVRAGCAQTASDFASTCKQACVGYRASFPNCIDQLNAMSGCVDKKVTFVCDANGAISTNPIAVCITEEYACHACTGDFAMCRN